MKLTEQRQKHINNLKAIFPKLQDKDSNKILNFLYRNESYITRLNVMDCNGEGNWERNENGKNRTFKRVKEFLGDKYNILYLNEDPRGHALKIKDEVVRERQLQINRDWGGYGILAPQEYLKVE